MSNYHGIFLGFSLFFTIMVTPAWATQSNTTFPPAQPGGAVNSYELFWPMVAGKTEGDPLYFLKTLKENVREVFIFGDAQKAEYAVFLATKRVLEAEVLIAARKEDLAIKALEKTSTWFTKMEKSIKKTKTKDLFADKSGNVIRNRLGNVQKLILQLTPNSQGVVKAKLQETDKQIQGLLSNLP